MNIYLLAGLGILLGVSLAGPPGPVTAVLVNRSMKSIGKGMAVGLGAMASDCILMVLILLFGQVTDLSRFNNYIYILGALFFFYLAYIIMKSQDSEGPASAEKPGFILGLSIGIVNPMQIGWWFTAGLSVFQKFGIITLFFLFAGILFWVIFLSTLIFKASAKYGDKVKLAIKLFSVISLSFFGVLFIYLAMSGIMAGL